MNPDPDGFVQIEDYSEFITSVKEMSYINFLVTFKSTKSKKAKSELIQDLCFEELDKDVVDELENIMPDEYVMYLTECHLKGRNEFPVELLAKVIQSVSITMYAVLMNAAVDRGEYKLCWDRKFQDFIFVKTKR